MMKATINGIAVEGTPQEIAEYQRIKTAEQSIQFKQVEQPPYTLLPKITCGGITTRPIGYMSN